MARVTVVMPVLNEEDSVADAVHSVLAQTFTDLEVFVVDGDSTDATARKVGEIAATEPRVHLLRNAERTIPHALNVALAQTRSEFLSRVDGHAAVNPTYLERAVNTLRADPQVAAVGGRRIGVAWSPGGVAVATALSSRFGVGDSINHYAESPQDTDHASFGMFRTEVLRQIDGWDEDLLVNEDVDLDHRILAQGYRIRFDPDMHIYWHVREGVSALARQYRRYGRGKAAMVRKNGRGAVRLRHLAPPVLFCVMTGAVGLVLIGQWPLGLLLAAPYACALAVATVVTMRTAERVHTPPTSGPSPLDRTSEDRTSGDAGRRPTPIRLVGAFMAMHLGWGLGFLEGLLFGLRPASASARLPSELDAPSSGRASRKDVTGGPRKASKAQARRAGRH